MNPRRFVILALLATLSSSATAQLTVIKLKSGETVEGYVVEQTAAFVKLETVEGKTLRYNQPDIASQEETARTGFPELDKKLEGVDRSDAAALAGVADWAKTQKMRAWTQLARQVLKADPQNEKANMLLGHVKAGERWYKSKAEAETARKAEVEAEMKAKGLIKVTGGWISKEDKQLFDKDKKNFALDDNGVYRDLATVMREKGLTLVKGKWVRGASPEDQAEVDEFKKLVGEDIIILRFDHFRLAMMNTPTEKIEEYGKLVEDLYAWFLKEMGKPPDHDLWPKRADLWLLKDKKVFETWFKVWSKKYGVDEKNAAFFQQSGGNIVHTPLLFGNTNLEGSEDVRNSIIHKVGHFLIGYFCGAGPATPPWLTEGWGHYCEHARLGAGHTNCSTKAAYGGAGGIADKGAFSTKDAKDRCRGLLREGSSEPMINLSKLDLNSLNGDHLAKGWSVVEWLMATRRQEFITWVETMHKGQEASLKLAIPGWDFAKLDEEWEAYVKAKY